MSNDEMRKELTQYACAALTGVLTQPNNVRDDLQFNCNLAWEYAQEMASTAPTDVAVGVFAQRRSEENILDGIEDA